MIKINKQFKIINKFKNKLSIYSNLNNNNNKLFLPTNNGLNIINNNNNNNNNNINYNNKKNELFGKYQQQQQQQQRLNYSTHVKEEMGENKKKTVLDILKKYKDGIPISMVTAYDFTSSKIVDKSGMDMILVGDSLGMVMNGESGTTSVTMEQMIYHCKSVMKGSKRSFVVGDMPFGSYETSTKDAVSNAIRLIKEGGVDAIKLEGGKKQFEKIKAICDTGILVVGHIGLTPQTSTSLGGFKLQGKTEQEALSLLEDAKSLQEAGCFAIVLEMVPHATAMAITNTLSIPTIGIGAGNGTSGQVLVYHDLLGLYSDFVPKFCKQYATLSENIDQSLKNYKNEVESREFPSPTHSFSMKESELSPFLDKIINSNTTSTSLFDKSSILSSNKNILNQNKALKQQQQQQQQQQVIVPNTTTTTTMAQVSPQIKENENEKDKIKLTPTPPITEEISTKLINNEIKNNILPNKMTLNGSRKPKIVVIGAGAMGSLFSAKLASKGIADVWMVSAWKEHVESINKNGMKFFNPQGKEENIKGIKATLDGMQVLKDGISPDLALVLVKSNSTKQAALTAATLVGGNPKAAVLTLQNGIGNREELESIINIDKGLKNHVWQGVTSNGAIVVSPGSVKQTGIGSTFLSSPYLNNNNNNNNNKKQQQLQQQQLLSQFPPPSTREEILALKAFCDILNESGISSDISDDLEGLVWNKVVANAAINPLSAVLGVSNGQLLENEYSKNLMKKIIIEALSVCKAKNISLPYGEDSDEAFKYVADIVLKTSANYSSMLQDILRGQPTEVNSINGVIVKEGEKFDLNVSHNKMIMEMVLSRTKTNPPLRLFN
ncbi:3-methyl-2-oxobutanoate hydroxymethyltransferase [Dictyostelium discoideum AX4]|uniref:3-methyl-2-oxobutanoate hydroxymethyltransferase n=1 Tax=Dictyostelium discoideum TaxID=44689 RepID=Q54LH3_DICDI|nr:3-methyl-2-oxobutanoate hydroxymethyltransferase [Dictyostelium discoideum AX4]EAL64074.1 3-methyl-2-oxobutanoate hydroxymethyltransferase [Dictyostelium discoideum AX4]|eukprot:XP_637588.1 3-methyl-2-oxobutanoate hydroxymethyltransferase [Dictyostelium discoideum AX4]